MGPTRIRLLVLLALGAGVLGWAAVVLVNSTLSRYVPVPWLAAGAIWLLAAALLMWTLLVRPRLLRKPGHLPLAPIMAARTAALALASSRTGAVFAGFYGGIFLGFLPHLTNPAGSQAAIVAGIAAAGGAAITGIALWLERICRIDEEDDEDGPATRYGGRAGVEPSERRGSPPTDRSVTTGQPR